MKHYTLIVVIALFVGVGCTITSEETLSDFEKQILTEEVNETLDNWFKMEAGDFENHFMNMLHLTPHFVMITDNTFIAGGGAIPHYLSQMAEEVTQITDVETPKRFINILSPEYAVVTFEFEEKVHLKSDQTIDSKGHSMYILEKIRDEWKIISVMSSHYSPEGP